MNPDPKFRKRIPKNPLRLSDHDMELPCLKVKPKYLTVLLCIGTNGDTPRSDSAFLDLSDCGPAREDKAGAHGL